MPMLVSRDTEVFEVLGLILVIGVIQDAKFKRREALADLSKAALKK